jgi:PTS system ascorbate-specific IIC component
MSTLLLDIWNFIFNQILAKPQLLLPIIVAIGYLLLKRPWTTVLAGAIKTSVGIMVLQAGSTLLINGFLPLIQALTARFGIQGTIIDGYVAFPLATKALADNASWVGYVILIALAVNILLVALGKYTKLHAVFLTGHIMFQQSTIATWLVLYTLGLPLLPTVLITGVIVGLYWAIGSNALIKPTAVVTNNAGFTIGHQQMLMDWVTAKFAHHFGDPKKSDAEKLDLPGWLSIFQDNIVAMSVIMFFFSLIISLALGQTEVQKLAGADNWLVFTLLKGLSFAVYITIILTGVRLFVAELANSFIGISKKLLKDAVVGVDCPALMPFSPNAWIMGFLLVTLGELVAILALILFKSPILIICGFVPLFFDGGPIGVYANKFGGIKAILFFCFLTGLLQVFGALIMIPMSGLKGGWMGNMDWTSVWVAITAGLRLVGSLFGLPVPPYGG